MNKEQLIQECLKMPESVVVYPYDPTTAVVKNKAGKSFALVDFVEAEKIKRNCGADAPVSDGDLFITLKCPPLMVEVLRGQYKAVLPGYYCNKNHWNTVILAKDVPIEEIVKMIKLSFDLVTPVKKGK